MLHPVVAAEVDLGLGVVAVAVGRDHRAEAELVVVYPVARRQRRNGAVADRGTPGRDAIRADAGVEAAATRGGVALPLDQRGGISDRNRDGVWNAGRPYQFRDTALVRYSRCSARVIPT